jgi:hypothetical protein
LRRRRRRRRRRRVGDEEANPFLHHGVNAENEKMVDARTW